MIAFEALSFCIYGVRQHHLPMPEDPLDDIGPDATVEAYRDVIGMIPMHIAEFTGWELNSLWAERVLYHFQQGGLREATDAFVGRLLTMSGANEPARDYGPISMDMRLTLDLTGAAGAFAATMPKACADVVQNMVADFGLDE